MKQKKWCRHIKWEQGKTIIGRKVPARFWIKLPLWFNDWEPVPRSWKLCPICATKRPKGK